MSTSGQGNDRREDSAASIPESEWIGGCPVYGRARTPQECEKCGGDLLKCPVYGDGERKRQSEDRTAASPRVSASTRALAKKLASEWMQEMREEQRDLYAANPDYTPTISEADYAKGERDIEAAMLRAAGLK